MDHIALTVPDLEHAVAFFVDHFGGECVFSDIGGHHLAFYVDHIDAAFDCVTAIPDVVVMEGPNGVAADVLVAGQRWFYFPTPRGMQLELTSCTGDGFYQGLPAAQVAASSDEWR
ncbi:hypothetical protein [Nocardia sp. NBC_01009]|uniref:hypothetical protein n=1 Tax=Nocardia sp. NBC_01009 TaxID=2975996 RepID=UPI00386FB814|nr:hypothetical protein OHA42_26150 [Nocardia sp. NBC_01009]